MGKLIQETTRYQNILDRAAYLFARDGFHATSMDALSKELGLGKGALYYHIHSKQGLLHDIHLRVAKDVAKHAHDARIVASRGDPESALLVIANGMGRGLIEYPSYLWCYNQERWPISLEDWRDIRSLEEEFILNVRFIIEQGRNMLGWTTRDAAMDARAFLGMVHWMFHWYEPSGHQPLAEILDRFVKLIVLGLAPRGDGI